MRTNKLMRQIIVSLLVIPFFSGCSSRKRTDVQNRQIQQNTNIEIISHRGANRLAPENTYASAQKAIENGAGYIEIDVRKSKDGVYYLFHDNTLERTTNGKGIFAEQNSDYINTLDAGSWFSHSFKGEKIPRFTEYLAWVKGKAKVYIDVKNINIKEVVDIIRKQEMEEDCFFYFRNTKDIKEFRKLAPNLKLKMNAGYSVQLDSLMDNFNPQIIETSPQYLTEEFVAACHEKGLELMVYAPGNEWKSYRKVLSHKVDMVQVDNPGLFNKMMNNNALFTDYKLIAHRGGIVEGVFNEFDPRSIQAAIDSGYYMLEIDVNRSKDGVLIVHHDDDFLRFFNNPAKVNELTWKEIKQLKSDRGNYHPLSFDEVAEMCSGKIKMMIDIKPSHASPEFYKKLGTIMDKYNLFEGAYFIDNDARNYFWGKAKFEFRIRDANKIKEQFDKGEDVSCHYFLFDHGNRINAEAVKWCQKNNIAVVVSVNIGHYMLENHMDGAMRDIEYWKNCGITEYQIDSDYDEWLPLAIN